MPPKRATMSQMAACPTGFSLSTTLSEQVLLSYGNSLSAGTLWHDDPTNFKSYQQLLFCSLRRWTTKKYPFNAKTGCSAGTVDIAGQMPKKPHTVSIEGETLLCKLPK